MSYLHFQVYPFHNIRDAGHLENLQEMRIGLCHPSIAIFRDKYARNQYLLLIHCMCVCRGGGVPTFSLKHENTNTYMQSLAFQLAVFNHIYLAVITEISMGNLNRYECSRNILNKVTYSFENDRPFKKKFRISQTFGCIRNFPKLSKYVTPKFILWQEILSF